MKTRDEQIEEAAHTLSHVMANPILRSMYPSTSRGKMYDVFKGIFLAGIKFADSHPAPSGKVLSDEERERFEEIKCIYAKLLAPPFRNKPNKDLSWLLELVERLTEQKPVRGGGRGVKEEIKHAAVKMVGGYICIGRSHADCFYQGQNIGLKASKRSKDQGFFTSKGRYVDRAEAAKIAKRALQLDLKDKKRKVSHLLSEDIWYQRDIIYCQMRGYCRIQKPTGSGRG